MSDFDKFKNLFNESNIIYDIIEERGETSYINEFIYYKKIKIDNGVGYFDFYAEFYFDENGKFLNHGVWE